MDNGGLKITQVRLLPRALHMGQASSSHPRQSMLRVDWDKKNFGSGCHCPVTHDF